MLKDEEFFKYGKRTLPGRRTFLGNNSKVVFWSMARRGGLA